MERKSIETFIQPIYFKYLPSLTEESTEIYVLIHGWSGNEDSMSIFSSVVPQNRTIVFPRGCLEIMKDNYGWVDFRVGNPTFDDYACVAEELFGSINELIKNFDLNHESHTLNLIGFSQGAAISATLSILFPNSIKKVALLAGFLPESPPAIDDNSLSAIQYYVAHGTEDQLVDFNKSLDLRNYFQQKGADVNFCQEEIGHKVGKNCLRNLKNFFSL